MGVCRRVRVCAGAGVRGHERVCGRVQACAGAAGAGGRGWNELVVIIQITLNKIKHRT
jgi:hypothetical protein